jgi:photosystem II stability/assembly factor-like uncharacterized protein
MFTPLRGWGLVDNMILSTTDGGRNWAQVPLPGATVDSSTRAAFVTADIAFFLAPVPNALFGQFFATRDGGQTWQIYPVPFSTADLYFVDDNVGFAFQTLSKSGDIMTVAIYQTLNRGATWEQVFISARNQDATNLPAAGIKSGLSFIDAAQGFIGLLSQSNDIGLYHSVDAGRTWAKQALDVPAGMSSFTASVWPPVFLSKNDKDGFLPVDFVATDTGASTRVFYVTHDAGLTWARAGQIPDGTSSFFIDAQTGWTWGRQGLYKTGDGAQTWSQLPVPFSRDERARILDFMDANNGWLVTVDAKNRLHTYTSTDGGGTWTVMIP